MLELGEEGVKKEELDVRETPVQGNVINHFVQAAANQDLAVAAGWTDLNTMTKTFTLTNQRKVIIFGDVQALPGDDIDDFGFELRIVIDGTEETNSERTFLMDTYDEVDFEETLCDGLNTSISLNTQHVKTLNAGSHTIKLQGKGLADGTTTAVRFKKRNMSIIII